MVKPQLLIWLNHKRYGETLKAIAPELVHVDRWTVQELETIAQNNRARKGDLVSAESARQLMHDANWIDSIYSDEYARKFDQISTNVLPDPELRTKLKTIPAAGANVNAFIDCLGINRPEEKVSPTEFDVIEAELCSRKLGRFTKEKQVRIDRAAAIVSISDGVRVGGARLSKSVLRVSRVRKGLFTKLQYNADGRDEGSQKLISELLPTIALDAVLHDTEHATVACLYNQECVIIQHELTADDLQNARIDIQHVRFARAICLRLSQLTNLPVIKKLASRLTEPTEPTVKLARPRQYPSANHEGKCICVVKP